MREHVPCGAAQRHFTQAGSAPRPHDDGVRAVRFRALADGGRRRRVSAHLDPVTSQRMALEPGTKQHVCVAAARQAIPFPREDRDVPRA